MTDDPADRPARVHHVVVERLLAYIAKQRLAPGAALPSERRLAETFGVSRTAVREALGVLEQRGLVTARRGAGHFVRDLGNAGDGRVDPTALEVASIADVLEVRIFLEQHVAKLACQRRTRDEAQRLRALAGRLDRWEDNLAFHNAMAAATHNFMLEQLVRQQMELLGQLHQRDHYADADQADLFAAEHRELAAAITARDEETALRLVRHHLGHTRHTLAHALGVDAPLPAEAAEGA